MRCSPPRASSRRTASGDTTGRNRGSTRPPSRESRVALSWHGILLGGWAGSQVAAAVVPAFPGSPAADDRFRSDRDLGQRPVGIDQAGPHDAPQLGVDGGIGLELAVGREPPVDLLAGALVGVLRALLDAALAVVAVDDRAGEIELPRPMGGRMRGHDQVLVGHYLVDEIADRQVVVPHYLADEGHPL